MSVPPERQQVYSPQVHSGKNINFNDDSLLDADESNDFELRNQNYNLKIQINNLEYEINKMSIDYEGKLKDLRQKYNVLERDHHALLDKYERSGGGGKEVREMKKQLEAISDENQQLRRKFQITSEENRVTPNFNAPEYAQDVAALNAFLQRPDSFGKIDLGNSEEMDELKERIGTFERENLAMKQQIETIEKERDQNVRKVRTESEERTKTILAEKDRQMDELRNEQRSLSLQLADSKKVVSQLSTMQNDNGIHEKKLKTVMVQYREKQVRIVELQESVSRLEGENSRIRSERLKVEEDQRHFQSERREWEARQKQLQDQLYSVENQFSDAKTQWLNEKLELKKQFNNLKFETSDQIGQLRSTCEEKTQECKRLKQHMLTLNDKTQGLSEKEGKYEELIQQNKNEGEFYKKKVEAMSNQLQGSKQAFLQRQQQNQQEMESYRSQVQTLRQELSRARDETRKSTIFVEKEQGKLQEDIKHKEDLIQILKIEKEEATFRERLLEGSVKEVERKVAEKEKVVQKLEEDIKIIKFDNSQLEIAMAELEERNQMLSKVKDDVEAMSSQLRTQKIQLKAKREEDEKQKVRGAPLSRFNPIDKKESMRSMLTSMRNNKEMMEFLQAPDHLEPINSKESEENGDFVVDMLKIQNSDLQAKMSELENKLDQKAMDLSIKEEQLRAIRDERYKSKELAFGPIIDSNKKTQFNAVFFENKINELQAEIKQVSNQKEREFQEEKKLLKKQIEEKYHSEMRKQNGYIHQLEKNINHINKRYEELRGGLDGLQHKNDELMRTSQEMQRRNEQLQRLNYNAKIELSLNLEEQNQILQRYRQLEDKYQEVVKSSQHSNRYVDDYHYLKQRYDEVEHKYGLVEQQLQKKSLMLQNANQQIIRLNEVLRGKEHELRSATTRYSLREPSPNNSFVVNYQTHHEERERSPRQSLDHEKSSEEDLLKAWTQKRINTPSFSRI